MLKKSEVALPRPCRIPDNVLFIYKNGQRKLNSLIKYPANSLLNTRFPMNRPQNRKKAMQKKPRIEQYCIVWMTAFRISDFLPNAIFSEIIGSSITETEPVKAFGKNINGNAMPVKTPYILKAVAVS